MAAVFPAVGASGRPGKPAAQAIDDDDLDAVAGGSDVSCACVMGGFFSASKKRPEEYDIPAMKNFADPATCAIFKDGWVERIQSLMKTVGPKPV